MPGDEHQLKEFLVEAGLLSHSQLNAIDEFAEALDVRFFDALLQSGVMSEDDARRAVARSLSIPFVELQAHEFEEDALIEIPEPVCRAYSAVVARKKGSTLVVLLLDFSAKNAIRALRLPFDIDWQLTDRSTIKRGLLQYQKFLKTSYVEGIAQEARAIQPPASLSIEDLQNSSQQKAVQRVLEQLLLHAVSQRATSIHLEQRDRGLLVRYRIGGILHDAMLLPQQSSASISARIKSVAQLPLDALYPHEGRFKVALPHGTHDTLAVRVATAPTLPAGSEKVTLHISLERTGKNNFTLESLGLHGKGLESVYAALQSRSGLFLLHGPEISGKTTFLYTLLDLVSDPTLSIASLENIVELRLPGVVQTETATQENNSSESLLRAVLHTDPDILMVSPFVQPRVIVQAAYAANSGTLVLADMEARSYVEAVSKIENSGIPPHIFASIVLMSLSVRIVRRLCPHHTQSKLSRTELHELEERGANLPLILETLKEEGIIGMHTQWKDVLFGRAESCPSCKEGYAGYIGLQEIVPTTLLIKDALIRGAEPGALETAARESRVLSLLEDGIYKAARGLTSVEEVLEATL